MRTTNRTRLIASLSTGPKTIAQMAADTGLSYSTIQRGLTSVKADQIEGTWPIEWSMAPVSSAATSSPFVADETTTPSVPALAIDPEELAKRWLAGRQQQADFLAGVDLTDETADPAAMAEGLRVILSTVSTLLRELDAVKDRPDWVDVFTPDEVS